MTGQRSCGLGVVALVAGLLGSAALPAGEGLEAPPGTVRIGLVQTLFRDVPEPMVQLLMQPFSTLMRSQTGLNGRIIMGGDAHELGSRLHEGTVDLGVFHGFEFAWAQQKY